MYEWEPEINHIIYKFSNSYELSYMFQCPCTKCHASSLLENYFVFCDSHYKLKLKLKYCAYHEVEFNEIEITDISTTSWLVSSKEYSPMAINTSERKTVTWGKFCSFYNRRNPDTCY